MNIVHTKMFTKHLCLLSPSCDLYIPKKYWLVEGRAFFKDSVLLSGVFLETI